MIVPVNGFGQSLPSSGVPRTDQNGVYNPTDRLATQTNIQETTGQQLAQATSPIVEISLTENNTKRGLKQDKGLDKTGQNTPLDQSEESSNPQELTDEEEQQVRDLKKRDAEVKAHEQAHAAVGGSYASAPTYEYTTGPDNKQYAIGGEVQIDSAPVPNNPEATIRKMDIVIRAALAPAEPSSQDKQVAAQAAQTRAQAQAELAKQKAGALKREDEEADDPLQVGQKQDNKLAPSQEIIRAITAYETANQLFGGAG